MQSQIGGLGKIFCRKIPGGAGAKRSGGPAPETSRAGGLPGGTDRSRLGLVNTERQDTGEWGERLAERHLCRCAGMEVLERRWTHKHGELDLVLRQGGVLVFVEVRVRGGGAHPLAAYQSIGRGKWRALRRTAAAYLRQCRWRPEAVRFDVVGIRRGPDGRLVDLIHWENVGAFGRNFRF